LSPAERLESIAADLLLARIGTGAAVHERVDLGQLVTRKIQQRTFDLAVRIKLMPGPVTCGVRMQLIRLFTNLLDNAERHAETTIDIEGYQQERHVYLALTDDGAGIPPRDRERVSNGSPGWTARAVDPVGVQAWA
jgi:signal transduction histidine kinase